MYIPPTKRTLLTYILYNNHNNETKLLKKLFHRQFVSPLATRQYLEGRLSPGSLDRLLPMAGKVPLPKHRDRSAQLIAKMATISVHSSNICMYLLCVWSRCVGRRRLCSVCVGVRIPVHSSGVGYLVFTVSCVLFLVSLLAVFVCYPLSLLFT